MMQYVHMKLYPGLPWQSSNQPERRLFISKLDLNLRKQLVKYYIWNRNLDTSESRAGVPGKF
jgi:hypothetical protein